MFILLRVFNTLVKFFHRISSLLPTNWRVSVCTSVIVCIHTDSSVECRPSIALKLSAFKSIGNSKIFKSFSDPAAYVTSNIISIRQIHRARKINEIMLKCISANWIDLLKTYLWIVASSLFPIARYFQISGYFYVYQ